MEFRCIYLSLMMFMKLKTKKNYFLFRIDGRCSHIGALLLTLQDCKLKGTIHRSRTSELCTWNVPKAIKIMPQQLDSIVVAKPKLYKGLCHVNTDYFHYCARYASTVLAVIVCLSVCYN